jgi:dynein heavy chain 1
VKDQQEAEKKKSTSQEIQEQLEVQTKHIKEKKSLVLEDLSKVEPAVQDAQQGRMVDRGRRRRGGSG